MNIDWIDVGNGVLACCLNGKVHVVCEGMTAGPLTLDLVIDDPATFKSEVFQALNREYGHVFEIGDMN